MPDSTSDPPSPDLAPKAKEKVKVTPLPKLKMIAVAATLLTESICGTMLLPFVGLYVAHLKGISVEDAGYSSGVLVGLFMLGKVLSSKLWGWLSDVYGRRPPLLIGLFAGAWTMLFFGMAPNIYVCCLMRFIHGFFNGNILIAKIIIADITDSTNAALGFSMIGLLWSVGAVIGPAIGGFLYDPLVNPSLQWMHVQEGSFLARHPAFLASLIICVYALSNFLLVLFLVPETNPHRTGSLRSLPVIGWVLNTFRPKAVTIVAPEDTVADPAAEAAAEKPPSMTYAKAMKDPLILTVTVLLMCICAADMTFVEIMPLWAIAPTNVGGMGFFSDGVGMLMLSFSVPTFLSNLIFPKIARKVNNYTVLWQGCVALFALSIFLTPFGAVMGEKFGFYYIMLTGSGKNMTCAACFTIAQLLTGRAAPPGTVGAVYGISQSFGAAVCTVVPFVVAPLFAWSISGGHTFPFNHYLVFFLATLPLFLAIFLSWKRKIERTDEELAALVAETAGEHEEPGDENRNEETRDDTSEDDDHFISLGSSFVLSRTENLFCSIPAMRAENLRQCQVADWIRRTAPRGRGKRLRSAAKTLQHEDWRLTCDERIEEEEDEQVA